MKRKELILRIEEETYNKLKEKAIEENRTINNMIETIIKEYIKRSDE